MLLRTTRRTHSDGTSAGYYHLAENIWDPAQKKLVTRIIHNFGRADDDPRDRLKRLAGSILSKVGDVEEMAKGGDPRLIDSYP